MSARAVIRTVSGLSIVLATSGSMKAQEPKASGAPKATASKSSTAQETPAQAVARLVEQLKRHPVQPKEAPDRVGLYLMDVSNGEVTLIADQPAPGLTHCGSPVWSHDGRRILFDATPGTQWSLTRLESIDLGEGRPTVTDLGTGNCPTFSPADDRIAFLSNADGGQNGVWLMKADGSDRRLSASYGKPMWSPAGRQLMIISFEDPPQVTLMDANPDKSGVLRLPGQQIYSNPSWAGEGTIVAVIGPTEGDTVALDRRQRPASGQSQGSLVAESKRTRRQAVLPDLLGHHPPLHLRRRRRRRAWRCIRSSRARPSRRNHWGWRDTTRDIRPRGFAGRPVRPLLRPRPRPDAWRPRARGRDSAKEDQKATGAASRRRQGKIYVTGQSEAGSGPSLIAIDPRSASAASSSMIVR